MTGADAHADAAARAWLRELRQRTGIGLLLTLPRPAALVGMALIDAPDAVTLADLLRRRLGAGAGSRATWTSPGGSPRGKGTPRQCRRGGPAAGFRPGGRVE
ncbi:MAG TPA: hypothetical protein VKU77_10390 [Streptosporangiaceae bacterium]|nr:hypothetical protein [Streptosporangiaceae bacterium]